MKGKPLIDILCPEVPPPMIPAYALWIPEWHPVMLNKLLQGHWGKSAALKATDREMISVYAAAVGLPRAQGRRKLSWVAIFPKGKRFPDKDSWDKSLRDALVACGQLINDSHLGVTEGTKTFARAVDSTTWGFLLLLQDE